MDTTYLVIDASRIVFWWAISLSHSGIPHSKSGEISDKTRVTTDYLLTKRFEKGMKLDKS